MAHHHLHQGEITASRMDLGTSPPSMSPMTMGGHSSSFTTPGGGGSGGPQYLPEYLLGDTTSVATSPLHSHRLWSASNLNDSYHQPSHSGGSRGNRSSLAAGRSTTPAVEYDRQRLSAVNTDGKHGGRGGPPTLGLFDEPQSQSYLTQNSSNSFLASPSLSSSYVNVGSNTTFNESSSVLATSPSAAQLDPFYTQGDSLKHDEDPLDATWVTVFGFPPSAVSFILQQFSQYGNIIEHKISGGNNWVHLHYQSRIQAKKALGKNGKTFAGNMMVGVTPCIDKSVMNEAKKENVSMGFSPLSFDPSNDSFPSVGRPTRPLGIRPLSQAHKTATGSYEMVPGNSTPQKNANVVSKAMEYVFGW